MLWNRLNYLGFISILLFTFHIGDVLASTLDADFKRGLQAARIDDYLSAQAIFENLQHRGMSTAVLYYNLGVTYYKLDKFSESQQSFIKIHKHKKFAAIACYNLGLVEVKRNNYKTAYNWFKKSIQNTHNNKLINLNIAMIETLEEKYNIKPSSNWGKSDYGVVSSYLAYDDNVDFSNDEIAGVNNAKVGDVSLELYANYNTVVSRKQKSLLWLGASFDYLKYTSETQNDYSQLELRIWNEAKKGPWNTKIGGRINQSRLGNQAYQRQFVFALRANRRITNRLLTLLRYRLTAIDSLSPQYDYLGGWRQNFRAEAVHIKKNRRIGMYYELELNNREDLNTESTMQSYSPTRHTLRLIGGLSISKNWRTALEFKYRLSQYPDEDVDKTIPLSQKREDNQYRYAWQIFYRINKQLEITGEINATDNRSNIQTSRYQRTVLSTGVNWYF